jgi:DNA-binding NtrC family response regulator
MVVDDEEMLAEYVQALLERNGYTTKSFMDPKKAIEFFAANTKRVSLIISDIKMPGMSGTELAKKATEIKPDVPIILISAYSELLPEAVSATNVRVFLEKPLMKTDLLQAIESLIGTGC